MRLTRPGAKALTRAGRAGSGGVTADDRQVAGSKAGDYLGVGCCRRASHAVGLAPAQAVLAVDPIQSEARLVGAPFVVVGQTPVGIRAEPHAGGRSAGYRA